MVGLCLLPTSAGIGSTYRDVPARSFEHFVKRDENIAAHILAAKRGLWVSLGACLVPIKRANYHGNGWRDRQKTVRRNR